MTPLDQPVRRPRSVVVAVLTYRRLDQVVAVLPLLVEQLDHVAAPGRVIVVDNDPDAGAREAVEALGLGAVTYVHEPEPGIAHGRNRALDEAGDAQLLAFIDDDERPSPRWLAALVQRWATTDAAAVTGPVEPDYPSEPDPWIAAGGFFVRKTYPDGSRVPAASTGNLLLDLDRLAGLRFDVRFGLTGGSDTLFTRSLVAAGGSILWCAEAVVRDQVPVDRATRRWVLRRAFRSGNSWTATSLALSTGRGNRAVLRARATVLGSARLVLGAGRYALGVPRRSLRDQARGLRTAARGLGLLSGAWGVVFQDYRRSGNDSGRTPPATK